MDERDWRHFLALIRQSLVVPVIGPQLLVAAPDRQSPQHLLATQLRKMHKLDDTIPLPRFRELNAVVGEWKAANPHAPLQDLYSDIGELIDVIGNDPALDIPLPLRQLAEIADFRLLVTLTPDAMLARALRQRIAVNEIVHSPYLSTPESEDDDLPADWAARRNEVQLLYLFGKSSPAPQFAIHDEDLLEYAHNVISRGGHSRQRFFAELRRKNLLLLGSNFPDWLGRFFLRAANNARLMFESTKRDWVIEEPQADESFTLFLRSIGRDKQMLTGQTPAEFVAELHQRWTDDRDKRIAAAAGTAAGAASAPSAAQGAVFFVSYSRGADAGAAQVFVDKLRQALQLSESEVWYDRHTLEPGQDFQRSIIEGINSAHYFVPLISAAADTMTDRFFRREWHEAVDRHKGIAGRVYVVPTIVDDDYDPLAYRNVPPEWVGTIDFGHAPRGALDGRTLGTLRGLLRKFRESASVGSP